MRADIWEKRMAMVRQFDGAGLTRKEIADRLGWCVESVSRYRKLIGADFRHEQERVTVTEREKAMAAMYGVGKTLNEIGELYGVSRERVRQILSKRFNYTAKDGGKTAQAQVNRLAKKQIRDAKSFEAYGCSYRDYRKLSLIGKNMVGEGQSYYRTPVGAFNCQRSTAIHRGLEWKMKLWEWWQVWQSSGKWESRGRDKGGYVMCRFKDTGAYEVGNVYIATKRHNSSFQPNNPYRLNHPDHDDVVLAVRKKRSPTAGRGSRKTKYHHLPVGVTMSEGRFMAQISTGGKNKYLGCFDSAEKASAAYQDALSAYLSGHDFQFLKQGEAA